MRLIDADEVRKYIAFDGDILIDDMPTIEAIPIEWIFIYSSVLQYNYKKCLAKMIVDWRKENEKRY